MRTILLDDYSLTSTQTAYSCFVSEYGLQHIRSAWQQKNIIHGAIGLIELIPIIGFIVSLFEKALASQYLPTDPDPSAIPPSQIRYSLICSGSQDDCCGSVETDQAVQICQSLNSQNTNGIFFSPSKIENSLFNGTCSAMSFSFADRYLEKRKTLSPEDAINQIAPDYENSSPVFRTAQAAFDTIGKAPGINPSDFNKAKIDAMIRFYNRRVIDASEEFNITNPKALSKIRKILRELKPGVHIIRTLLPGATDKGEILGHTTVLISEEEKHFFYDPCVGTRKLEKGYESTTLCNLFYSFHQTWNIYLGRFYQIA